ncbi:MAG: ATP-dependent DNA helicase RecG [Candidatus Curtissbacteria bacterium GW2011_GWA1_40_9]|uniref:Probable DNA 3'-5' helicase RecG n=1 Tax=Candidatus Curtissbacteria bacterium GW2011_GWA1_40_9 TaxID=1618408 RepID=A0A0G0TMP7_9BACT|nr:MAG: ATP-dependent DNA helicase RecG [Candidatus Curtissbacteria bacterium GW2011_GWA1_40_9]
MDPNLKVEFLPGVGSAIARKLKKLNVSTAEELIYHFPFRYDDFSQIESIQNLENGQKLTVQGVVWQIKNVRTRTGKFLTQAKIADKSGVLDVLWFNQPYLTKSIKAGTQVSLSGKISTEYGRPKLVAPSYEILKIQQSQTSYHQSTTHTGRLVPIYPETEGLSSKWIRTKIRDLLFVYTKTNEDFLPGDIIKRQNLENLKSSLKKIHFPKNYQDVEIATKRLGFDELFLTQLLAQIRKKEWREKRKAPKLTINENIIRRFVKSFKFDLTSSQKKTIRELLTDMACETPANRLLEGDVGSGKTIIAAIGCLVAATNASDSLIAAPTEILAFQHYKLLKELLEPLKISVGIWTASKKEQGEITVGTHALLTSYIPKRQIGFVVVDEQHRFGVAQRAKLFMNTSKGLTPHLLTMTATPIPRTLALTMYGDLDLSVLDEMPKGRQKISTFVVPNTKRDDCYRFIESQVHSTRQAFIITPFVEPSESMETVKAATAEFKKLKSKFSKSTKLGLLHGRLKSKEKEDAINKFKSGKIDILVATPVVEVGIDVPNATVIVIESADRFGLAQLHQLRGRVGRAQHKSYCFLFSDTSSENSQKRLKSMEKVHVGFELAEIDLKLRGAGEIFGTKQSGFLNFKIADITNQNMIARAQNEAKQILLSGENLKAYPKLKKKLEQLQNQYSQPN